VFTSTPTATCYGGRNASFIAHNYPSTQSGPLHPPCNGISIRLPALRMTWPAVQYKLQESGLTLTSTLALRVRYGIENASRASNSVEGLWIPKTCTRQSTRNEKPRQFAHWLTYMLMRLATVASPWSLSASLAAFSRACSRLISADFRTSS